MADYGAGTYGERPFGMTQCTADFEAGTAGNNVLTTDTGSATPWDVRLVSGGSYTYSNDITIHGNLCAKIDSSSSGSVKLMEWTTALGTITEQYGRVYIYITARPGGDSYIIQDDNTTGFRLRTTGAIQLFASNTSTGSTSTTTLSTETIYRLEYHIVYSATVGQMELKIFSGENTTPLETVTTAANKNTGASASGMYFGTNATTAPWIMYMDSIVAGASSYPGPVVVAGGGGSGTSSTNANLTASQARRPHRGTGPAHRR